MENFEDFDQEDWDKLAEKELTHDQEVTSEGGVNLRPMTGKVD
jgi:hypothetical protein